MSADTAIEWATKTWNPLRGCSKVSAGCQNCYAIRMANRFSGPAGPYEGLVQRTSAGLNWTGIIRLVPEALHEPFRWKRQPERIFVNSMSDLFHTSVPDEFIVRLWEVMAATPAHTFMILTKRPERMQQWVSRFGNAGVDKPFLPNVWLGVSVENQKAANERIPLLLETPAAVRFLSCEPLLGPVDLRAVSGESGTIDALGGSRQCPTSSANHEKRIHWVIGGGESGPGARPMHPGWARSIRDQCQEACVPFLFKQWGEYQGNPALNDSKGRNRYQFDDGVVVQKMGKKFAGRELDGRTWDEFPEPLK